MPWEIQLLVCTTGLYYFSQPEDLHVEKTRPSLTLPRVSVNDCAPCERLPGFPRAFGGLSGLLVTIALPVVTSRAFGVPWERISRSFFQLRVRKSTKKVAMLVLHKSSVF